MTDKERLEKYCEFMNDYHATIVELAMPLIAACISTDGKFHQDLFVQLMCDIAHAVLPRCKISIEASNMNFFADME